jgi:hypothetical protein
MKNNSMKIQLLGPLWRRTLESQQCTENLDMFAFGKSCTLSWAFCKDSLHDLTMQTAKRVKLYVY